MKDREVEQITKADRLRVSRILQGKQSPRHTCGGLVPPFYFYNNFVKFQR